MDMETVKKYLEEGTSENGSSSSITNSMPFKFLEPLIMQVLRVDFIKSGRIICSMKNSSNFSHGGATATLVDLVGADVVFTVGSPFTGVTLEMNVNYLDAAYVDEEIEIEAKVLRVGKAVGVLSVELRKKNTGKLIAQGRQTKYLAVSSKI